MTHTIILVIGFFGMLALVAVMASKNGSKAAQLENLKAELRKRAEEQARAQRITDSVRRKSTHSVRSKLQQTK